jgi:hypothetical protein
MRAAILAPQFIQEYPHQRWDIFPPFA